ncbi:MAG: hypothetical protein AAGA05_13110 [Pseudomonadota bacterium]
MSEGGISHETMLNGLRDIRLPPEAAGSQVADVFAVAGLSLGAAVLAVLLARSISQAKPKEPPLVQQIETAAHLHEDDRRVLFLHLLKSRDPAGFNALSDQLYRPDRIDLATLETEVRRLV